MKVKLTRLIVIIGLFLLVFGLSSTVKVVWTADPAMTSPTPGSTLKTTDVTFDLPPFFVPPYITPFNTLN